MKNENNKHSWCVNPYMNLSVHPKGTIKTCCMSGYELTTDSKSKTINEASILEFWNSDSRRQLINDLKNGIKVPECTFCWQEEEAGKESKRIRDNRTYADIITDDSMLPIVVDLSMGNLCNLKCRICSPTHSSPWMIEESSQLPPEDKTAYLKQPRWKIASDSFDYKNKFLWDDITALLPNVTKFDFAGGEPFYIEKHWSIVSKCVENGWSKKQHIHYNTNGTIYPEKYMPLLEEFKIVDIQISSDGVAKKFEYCRHPAVWEEVEENIDKFISARDSSNTAWILSVCISVSAFNVYDFFETYEHYASKGIGIYVNIVHDHHGTKVLPSLLKQTIIDRLNKFESKYLPHQWKNDRDMVVKHLSNTVSVEQEWINFWSELEMRDTIRKESFKEIYSEYYNEIKKYL
jgi:MoaA/NifB/PqqE/SkfB family radical SAM enzyme